MDTGTEALHGVRLPSSGRWGHLLQVKQQETFEVFIYYTKNIINAGSFTLLCVNIYLYLYFI